MCLCLLTKHICIASLGTTSTCLGFGICIYMRTWCLDFDVYGAFELVNHMYTSIVLFGRVFMHVRY